MTFSLDAVTDLDIPAVLLWTSSACGFMCNVHYRHLVDRRIIPLKKAQQLANGYLDTAIDWVPGMKSTRLRDFPTFLRTTDPEDTMLNFVLHIAKRAASAATSAIVFNTFNELESPVLDALAAILPPVYSVGPLALLARRLPPSPLDSLHSNLWKEDDSCLAWLSEQKPGSVVYVNFGSITVMSNHQLVEFAWGLANSGHEFLRIIRPDLVKGESAVLPPEFMEEAEKRGHLASWCSQEAVLRSPAVGGFLTHSGWNSTMESMCGRTPMLSWPFFAEQQTNCRYVCGEWGVGMEIAGDMTRETVERLIRELMAGEKGRAMRRRVAEWKESAERAARPGGSSLVNLERLVDEVLVRKVA